MYIFKTLTPDQRTDLAATIREIDLIENDGDVIRCEINSYGDDSIQLAVEDSEFDPIGIVTCTINQATGDIVGVIQSGSMDEELLDVILNEMNAYEPSLVEEVDENETNNESNNENEMVVQMNIAPVERRPGGNEPNIGGSRKKKSKKSKKSRKSKKSKKSKKSQKTRKSRQ